MATHAPAPRAIRPAVPQRTFFGHPGGLPILFLTEMWERFSFYLMVGILPLYLADSEKGGMGMSAGWATAIVGSYGGLVYVTPFIGGLVADRLLGCRKTILIGGVLMMLGHLSLAWPTLMGLYLGLALLILGNGAFKPNISTLLGNLYPPGSPLKSSGYSIFYVGINIGAFICNFVAALVRNYFDKNPLHITSGWTLGGWHAAFGTAAIGMAIALVLFASNYRRFAAADQVPSAGPGGEESMTPFWVECIAPAVVLGAVGWFLAPHFGLKGPTGAFLGACLPTIFFYLRIWRKVPDPVDRGRVAALLVVFAVSIIFWTVFYLSVSTLTYWAQDDTNRQPTAVVRKITDAIPEFAENAPPSYYSNAGPDVPRPAPDNFEVVSEERYQQFKKEQALRVVEGQKVQVTKPMFDEVYAGAGPDTPRLPEGQHLRLVNTELFQSIEPGFVILFTPLVLAFWGLLRRRSAEPSTAAKIAWGVLLTAGAPAIMLAATIVSGDGRIKASPWWLIGVYAQLTVAELFLSPMGLSLTNKMSPARIRAFMMGGWFVATGIGAKLSGLFGEAYQTMEHRQFWLVLIACEVVTALFIFLLLPWLNRQMASQGT